jgi:hypothetical protein
MKEFICQYCGRECKTKQAKDACESSCLFMIKCYQDVEKVSFEKAKNRFIMELL